eukprot:7671429-Pyramimonas_sp.AAC.1
MSHVRAEPSRAAARRARGGSARVRTPTTLAYPHTCLTTRRLVCGFAGAGGGGGGGKGQRPELRLHYLPADPHRSPVSPPHQSPVAEREFPAWSVNSPLGA